MLNHLRPILYISNLLYSGAFHQSLPTNNQGQEPGSGQNHTNLQLYPRAVRNATKLPSSLGKSVDPVAQCFTLLVECRVIVVDGCYALTEFHVHA